MNRVLLQFSGILPSEVFLASRIHMIVMHAGAPAACFRRQQLGPLFLQLASRTESRNRRRKTKKTTDDNEVKCTIGRVGLSNLMKSLIRLANAMNLRVANHLKSFMHTLGPLLSAILSMKEGGGFKALNNYG